MFRAKNLIEYGWSFLNTGGSQIVGFLWGVILLSSLFVTHLKELNVVLSALEVPLVTELPEVINWTYFTVGCGFVLSVSYRKLEWLLLVCFLFFAQFTNLIFAFGLYFIFDPEPRAI